jgi:hypothetical protein
MTLRDRLGFASTTAAVLLAVLLAACNASPDSTSPQSILSPPQQNAGEKIITVNSRYGHGAVSAPTREGQAGPEVRLPSGSWISCKGDCRTTLREETVDFWDVKVPAASPGR